MKERELKQLIQQQADKIKELETDFEDEFTKGVLKTKEIDKLNRIIKYFDVKLKDNAEYQKLRADLIGGKEEQEC